MTPEETILHLRAICDMHHAILTTVILKHTHKDAIIADLKQLAAESEDVLLGTAAPDAVAALLRRYFENFVRGLS